MSVCWRIATSFVYLPMLVKDFWHSFFVTPLHLNSIKSKYFCIPLALDETPAKEIRKTEFFLLLLLQRRWSLFLQHWHNETLWYNWIIWMNVMLVLLSDFYARPSLSPVLFPFLLLFVIIQNSIAYLCAHTPRLFSKM